MRTLDVPQANDLYTVRAIVHAIHRGATDREALMEFTGFSKRHTSYRLQAARVLGFIELNGDEARLKTLGEALLSTSVGTQEERAIFHRAVERCAVVQVLASELLAEFGPTVEALTERITEQTKLKASTARRRASCLLSWRFAVLGLTPEQDAANHAKRAAATKTDPPSSTGLQLSLFG